MGTIEVTQPSRYSDPEQETVIQQLKDELLVNMETQARHHGGRNIPVHIDEYRAYVFNAIETQVQVALDFNQQRHLPISGMVMAKKIQSDAIITEAKLQASLLDEEQRFKNLEQEIGRHTVDALQKYWRSFVHCILALIALSEGCMAYPAFRFASFPKTAAVAASFGIVAAVALGAIYLADFIQQAKTEGLRYFRYALVIIIYFTGFYFLGEFRANTINNAPDLNMVSGAGQYFPAPSVCGCAIAVVSFLLFWLALFLCLRIWRSKKERDQEHLLERKVAAKETADIKIGRLRNELQNLQFSTNEQVAQALARFEYAMSVENDLIGFARLAADRYKDCNLRHRTDGLCPDFYSFPPPFNFKIFFNNVQTR